MPQLVRVEGTKGSRAYLAYSPDAPHMPIRISADYILSNEWGQQAYINEGIGNIHRAVLVATFPREWALVEVGKITGPATPSNTEGVDEEGAYDLDSMPFANVNEV